ncbi:MAG: response regulator, partial [Betaproteobacteria bacterium]|nr:response regulator [Betaproteobacteria bacterium]
MKKIRAFIVDDSAVVREAVRKILTADPAIEVIGVATDPIFAMEKMVRDWPDVIVLDIEMPRMDGLTFLRKIMAERPTPVVICSTLSQKGAEETFQALTLGAVACIGKPKDIRNHFVEDAAGDL